MSFTKDHAEKSARKLKTKPTAAKYSRLQVIEQRDGPHLMQQIWCDGVLIGKFGIKHASSRNDTHGWVARELNVRPHDMYQFAICTITIDEMIQHFIDQGLIPAPEDDFEDNAE